MERLLITKSGSKYSSTIAADSANSLTTQSQLNLLQEGSIVLFEKGGTRGTAAGSYTKTDKYATLAVGMPTGVATRVSPLINMSTLSYNKNPYRAAKAQVTVLGDDGVTTRTTGAFASSDIGTEFICTVAPTGTTDFREGSTALLRTVSTGIDVAADTVLVLNEKYVVIAAGTPDNWGGTIGATLVSSLAGTLTIGSKVVGSSYGVSITDLDKEVWERRTYDVSLVITDSSISDADLLAALVAEFNSNTAASAIATAAVATGDAGIVFTSVAAGGKFNIAAQGLLYGSTVTCDDSGLSQLPIIGEGTNAQILKLEAKTIGIEGATGTHSNDEMGEIWKLPSLVESGKNYVVYVLTWTDQREVAYVSNNANPQHKILNLAVPSDDATMITAMDNLLADMVA